jgi:hypothetical protein
LIQACEQLNAWLGGFESILKRMTPSNFNWFLHVMLFLHTSLLIEKQATKANGLENEKDEEDEEEEGDDTGDNID